MLKLHPTWNRQAKAETLLLVLLGSVLFSRCALWAQEGVAGDNPVAAKPKDNSTPEANKLKGAAPIRVQSTLVTTPVTVLDSSGQYVYDLDVEDFKILDNGAPQHIDHFDMDVQGLAAVVVIQTNNASRPLLDDVRPLGSMFSTLVLGKQGEAAVITYGDRVRLVQDFTKDSDRLESALRGLEARGDKAPLNDALARAVAMLAQRPKDERRVIVAFSDGYDRESETSKDDVVQRASGAEVTIYGLGFRPSREMLARRTQAPPPNPLDTNVARPLPPNVPATPTNSENVYQTSIPVVPIILATGETIRSTLASSLLEYYAGYTGGVFYSHGSKKAVQDQLNRIASEIHSQYELAYAPDTLGQAGFHRIQVQVRRRGVKVRTRAGYFFQGAKAEGTVTNEK